jgi:hypothetical protein
MSSDSDILRRFEDSAQSSLSQLKSHLTALASARTQREGLAALEAAEAGPVAAGDALFRDFKREQRHLGYEEKQRAQRSVKTLQADWEAQKAMLGDYKRRYLGDGGGGGTAGGMNAVERAEWTDQRQRLLQAREVQSGNSQSLAMTQRTIEDAAMVGAHTSVQLEHQTEQMEGVIDTLHETNSLLDKSAVLLRRMRTRLVTNKLLTCVIITIELAICALIIYIKFYT